MLDNKPLLRRFKVLLHSKPEQQSTEQGLQRAVDHYNMCQVLSTETESNAVHVNLH